VKHLFSFIVVLLLAGCAAVPGSKPSARLYSAADLEEWAFNGRVSLVQGETGWHAGLVWREQAGDYTLRVTGPLGQGAFELSGDPAGVQLVDAEQRTYTARDPDALLEHITGWTLPVSGMHYWVRGLAVPQEEAVVDRDEIGRVTRLDQAGWEISYDRYQRIADIDLPGRLRLAREGVSVRVVIDDWLLPVTAPTEP